jgi:hypothetical protein
MRSTWHLAIEYILVKPPANLFTTAHSQTTSMHSEKMIISEIVVRDSYL